MFATPIPPAVVIAPLVVLTEAVVFENVAMPLALMTFAVNVFVILLFEVFAPTVIRFVPSEVYNILSVIFRASSPAFIYCVFDELVVFGVLPAVLVLFT